MSITTCLWFQSDIEAALNRYVGLFPDSQILSLTTTGTEPAVQLASWRMFGTTFRGICQPVDFHFSESISLSVSCADQNEVDRYWFGLLDGGGQESMCGWLKDPWGVSWQVVPVQLEALLGDPDPARAAAATAHMLTQRRLVIADLQAAADRA
ncbi:MAG: VOC family protein [Nostocoides sp.]